MLNFLLGSLALGVLTALGFGLHLLLCWLSGTDYRTPEERAWEQEEETREGGADLPV